MPATIKVLVEKDIRRIVAEEVAKLERTLFRKIFEEIGDTKKVWVGPNIVNDEDPIAVLRLGNRATHCLLNAGVKTIGELCQRGEWDLRRTRNLGAVTILEIKTRLGLVGRKLRAA